MIAYEDLDRPQSLLSLGNRIRTTLWTSEICDRIFEPDICQFLLASRDTHYSGAT